MFCQTHKGRHRLNDKRWKSFCWVICTQKLSPVLWPIGRRDHRLKGKRQKVSNRLWQAGFGCSGFPPPALSRPLAKVSLHMPAPTAVRQGWTQREWEGAGRKRPTSPKSSSLAKLWAGPFVSRGNQPRLSICTLLFAPQFMFRLSCFSIPGYFKLSVCLSPPSFLSVPPPAWLPSCFPPVSHSLFPLLDNL